jgi:uncharacterized protein YdhG (YjbR/CyaY superfamily)
MADDPVQSYLDALDEPARSTLGTVRDSILQLRPDAQPCLSYGAPAFTVEGKVIAGLREIGLDRRPRRGARPSG